MIGILAERCGIVRVIEDVVLKEDLENNVNREDIFAQVDAATESFDGEGDVLPGSGLLFFNRLVMRLFDDVGPCVADIGEVTVVGCVVNEEADGVVACLVGVGVVKLESSVSIHPLKYHRRMTCRLVLTSSRGWITPSRTLMTSARRSPTSRRSFLIS
jgi:hypothetical protein